MLRTVCIIYTNSHKFIFGEKRLLRLWLKMFHATNQSSYWQRKYILVLLNIYLLAQSTMKVSHVRVYLFLSDHDTDGHFVVAYLFLGGHFDMGQCTDGHLVAVSCHQADLMFDVVSPVAE